MSSSTGTGAGNVFFTFTGSAVGHIHINQTPASPCQNSFQEVIEDHRVQTTVAGCSPADARALKSKPTPSIAPHTLGVKSPKLTDAWCAEAGLGSGEEEEDATSTAASGDNALHDDYLSRRSNDSRSRSRGKSRSQSPSREDDFHVS